MFDWFQYNTIFQIYIDWQNIHTWDKHLANLNISDFSKTWVVLPTHGLWKLATMEIH